MQFLRNLIEKQRKLYHAPGSKFHKAWPLFDAIVSHIPAPKDDGGAVIVTLAPRETSMDSGDALRFTVRGDSLVSEDRVPGAEALTLTRSR